MLGLTPRDLRVIWTLSEALAGILADRLEQQETGSADRLDQVRLDEGVEIVEGRVRNRLGRFERERACERCEAHEDSAKLDGKEVVAPFDRRAQRALARGCISTSRRQQRQPRVEACEQRVGIERTQTRRRELERERQAIETCANLDRRRGRLEARSDGTRALRQQLDGRAGRQRLGGVLVLGVNA